jgi:hypothetical protein
VSDARRITLSGSTDGAYGLDLLGHTLYVANTNGVVRIDLSRSLTTGQAQGTTMVPGAAWPSAVRAYGCHLYVLDANFGTKLSNIGNPAASFQIIAIPVPDAPDLTVHPQ